MNSVPLQVANYDVGMKRVVEGDYVVLGEEETITVLQSYTCDVVKVKNFQVCIIETTRN